MSKKIPIWKLKVKNHGGPVNYLIPTPHSKNCICDTCEQKRAESKRKTQ